MRGSRMLDDSMTGGVAYVVKQNSNPDTGTRFMTQKRLSDFGGLYLAML